MRKPLLVVAVVLGAVALIAAGGVLLWLTHRPLNSPRQVAAAYLRRWQAQDWEGMRKLVDRPPPEFVPTHVQMVRELRVSRLGVTGGGVHATGPAGQSPFSVEVSLQGLGTWDYRGTLHLVRRERRWRVAWSPATVHPDLAAGRRFARVLHWPDRASILGRDGTVLQGPSSVVVIGVVPGRVTDGQAVVSAFQQYAGVDPAAVTRVLQKPGLQPAWFYPVLQVSSDRFGAMSPQLVAVPGIEVEHTKARASPSAGFALHVLGTTGPVTAERLAQLGDPYVTGTVVGLSGLEGAFERQLAGIPSAEIQVVDRAGGVVAELDRFPGTPAQPVQTTLDPAVQSAAEATFGTSPQAAALVALDAATGEIRAVVSRPLNNGFDRALAGSYPPGSTFKVVTTAALLAKGDDLGTPISCPQQAVVGGRHFKNIENETLGDINLQTAFVQSCNTAYVQMAATLTKAQLTQAAHTFGFGVPEPLPLTSTGSSFPDPKDLVAQASAAIGQAQVMASPLHMASVAAAVASGAWHQPTLVAGAGTTATVRPLDPGVAQKLRTLMGLVVSDPKGTGVAAALPGTPVAGKTGTAEYGSGNPPATHAWFIGFRGGLAFAVLVEGGGVGGKVAAPLAARFLSQLPG